jgi:hypothetical protein
MVFKLTKAETVARDRLVADLRTARENAERAISTYNDALQAVRDFVEQRATAWRDQHNGRSQRWQRSDAGSVADAFISEWEGYQPEDAEPPEPEVIEEFDALPSSAGR